MMPILSKTPDDTLSLGKRIGSAVTREISIALTGGLGAGKTTFVQGIAQGLGVSEKYYITSPTFTIVNTYPADPFTLCHLDLYRLSDDEELAHIGFDDLLSPDHIIVVEWPELLNDISFRFDLEVDFQFDAQYNRIISIGASGQAGTNLLSNIS